MAGSALARWMLYGIGNTSWLLCCNNKGGLRGGNRAAMALDGGPADDGKRFYALNVVC